MKVVYKNHPKTIIKHMLVLEFAYLCRIKTNPLIMEAVVITPKKKVNTSNNTKAIQNKSFQDIVLHVINKDSKLLRSLAKK